MFPAFFRKKNNFRQFFHSAKSFPGRLPRKPTFNWRNKVITKLNQYFHTYSRAGDNTLVLFEPSLLYQTDWFLLWSVTRDLDLPFHIKRCDCVCWCVKCNFFAECRGESIFISLKYYFSRISRWMEFEFVLKINIKGSVHFYPRICRLKFIFTLYNCRCNFSFAISRLSSNVIINFFYLFVYIKSSIF